MVYDVQIRSQPTQPIWMNRRRLFDELKLYFGHANVGVTNLYTHSVSIWFVEFIRVKVSRDLNNITFGYKSMGNSFITLTLTLTLTPKSNVEQHQPNEIKKNKPSNISWKCHHIRKNNNFRWLCTAYKVLNMLD